LNRQSRSDPSLPPLRTDLNTNIVWLNADQLPSFARSVGSDFFEGRYTVGYWAWETEMPHWLMADMSRLVDEIWTPSTFCKRCIEAATAKPVLTFPHPVPDPRAATGRARYRPGMPDGFVFLFMFDFFSTLARKNPIGLVDAFCRAFEPGEGPTLVLKSINGSQAVLELERLRYAFADRTDIVLIDEYFSPSECVAMLADADCYVSLHRAEGFGLTIADAMALGTPVIASGYSGNLEFMDDDTGHLVPVKMTHVGPGAFPYPPDDVWAEPDLDVAADLMQRVYRHPAEARRKAAAGRRAILTEHGHARAVRFLTAQYARIQDLMRSGFTTDVAECVDSVLAAPHSPNYALSLDRLASR
jgi:glycosyltransferase involved in cell wall biosynthesis